MRILNLASMLGILAAFFLCLPDRGGAQEVSGYTVITAADLKKMQDSGKEMLIIDTLAESAYKQGHIPGGKNFEFPNGNMDPWDKSKTASRSKDDFVELLGRDKEKPLVFYCLDEK
ncbi:MAG TPA: rhodanese-like domain-containing protein [Syntrophobacteria bacterium]|nr:rhodanese-like domain-containing protein [Syntrophobacteria bacterium]